MKLLRAAAAVSFFGALAIGITVAGFFAGDAVAEPLPMVVLHTCGPMPERALPSENVAVYAEDLVGVWRGTWDHAQVPAALTINHVDGNRFFGILNQGDAEIAFSGTIDEGDRRVFFHETKVLRLGVYGEWSLGTNSGAFSADGRTLTGTGVDKWGAYRFDLAKDVSR